MEDIEILKKSGLNDAQAVVYYTLLTNGELTPTGIAEKTKESRENCYLVAKKLEEMGLIKKTDAKKTTYRALNPSNLEILAEKRRKIMQKNEKALKDNMSSLLTLFYANNEMPGSRTLDGIEGIKEVYNDTLRVKKDIYFLRTQADLSWEGSFDFLSKYREKRASLGIHTYAMTPIVNRTLQYMDDTLKIQRIWIDDSYTAPVEIDVYGDKVALISFGEMPLSTIITSPLIAEAMRQILKIMMAYYKEKMPENAKK